MRDLESLEWPGMLATEACLEELPVIPERDNDVGVCIWGSDPMDPMGDTTTSTDFTAWVGSMWRTSASVNPAIGYHIAYARHNFILLMPFCKLKL